MTRPSEDDLIARYFRPLATHPGALGLGDDCAMLTPPAGHDLVLKTDAVAEGVHFFSEDAWDAVAKKTLRVNLSDLAAKGARPLGYLLSLALPKDWTEPALAAFAAGLAEDQAHFGIALLGGDTIRSPQGLVITITVIGTVPSGRMARRGGAQAGDHVYVTGTIGDAALGLQLRLDPTLADTLALSAAERAHLIGRYLLPQPRGGLAAAVLAHASGAMDISDGLLLDASRMARVSGVEIEIAAPSVPLSSAARVAVAADLKLLTAALTGGDDYELLLTVAPALAARFEADAAAAGIAVTRIGRVTASALPNEGGDKHRDRVKLVDSNGRIIDITTTGYSHF